MMDLSLLGDIDIDTGDRNALLGDLQHIPASIHKNGKMTRHNTGVYFHTVPVNPFGPWCSIHYEEAEQQGCYKIDVLNNHVYKNVRSETHLIQLMETSPVWEMLDYPEIVSQLIHINQHYDLVNRLKPRSVEQLAMVLALIRPGKRHLVNRCHTQGWDSIANEIWLQDKNGYTFKKSHGISLAMVVIVQMNLMVEQIKPEISIDK
jgi:hypothetical protein